jgi:hypothetical protein
MPVGVYPLGSTPEGICDLAGNVWEWCDSLYREGSENRVLRGGSFNNNADNVLSAFRNNNQPDNRNNNIGFRVASTLRQTNGSVMPEFAGRVRTDCPADCAKCKVQAIAPCRAADSSAEPKTGPAGLVGRKARTPRRATCWHIR